MTWYNLTYILVLLSYGITKAASSFLGDSVAITKAVSSFLGDSVVPTAWELAGGIFFVAGSVIFSL